MSGLPGAAWAIRPELLWLPAFLAPAEADALLLACQAQLAWEQRTINFAGRRVAVPRLVAWYGEEAYRYGGFTHPARALPALLQDLRVRLEAALPAPLAAAGGPAGPLAFNSVLLNLYRDGADSMSFHADNEAQLGPAPVIASLSLGATRTFQLRSRPGPAGTRRVRVAQALTHGSLLVMYGRCQQDWEHAIPKEPCTGPRVNLTFRHTAPLRPAR